MFVAFSFVFALQIYGLLLKIQLPLALVSDLTDFDL
jgi:hypothetical protein